LELPTRQSTSARRPILSTDAAALVVIGGCSRWDERGAAEPAKNCAGFLRGETPRKNLHARVFIWTKRVHLD